MRLFFLTGLLFFLSFTLWAEEDETNYSLYELAIYGKDEEIKKILEKNPSLVNPVDYDRSCLEGAVRNENAELVRYLIEKGADVNYRFFKTSPLHYAIEKGNREIITLLVEAGADVNALDFHGRSSLYLAADENDIITSRYLIEKGATGVGKISPYEAAASVGNWEIFTYMLDQGIELSDYREVLYKALYNNMIPVVQHLVETFNIDLNVRIEHTGYSDSDYLPLEKVTNNASYQGEDAQKNRQLFYYLLEKGADPIYINEGDVMFWAAKYSNPETFDYFLEKGFRFDYSKEPQKGYYLAEALSHSSFHAACYLLDKEGRNPYFKDQPLIFYFTQGYYSCEPEFMEFFIKENVNTDSFPDVFFLCVRKGIPESVILFLENGIDLNLKDGEGRNALWYAHDKDMIELLIGRGIDVSDQITHEQLAVNSMVLNTFLEKGISITLSQEGLDSALRWAARLGYSELAEYLIKNGADVNGHAPLQKEVTGLCKILSEPGPPLIANARQGYEYFPEKNIWRVSWNIAKMLIEAGADVNAEDEYGMTALEYALRNLEDEEEFWFRSFPYGAREMFTDGSFWIDYPEQGHASLAWYLISSGADVNRLNKKGYPPLLQLIENHGNPYFSHSHYEYFLPSHLLEYGADINFRAEDGMTPLLLAAIKGDYCILDTLLKAGADITDINVYNQDGYSPLLLAASKGSRSMNGYIQVVKLLLESGADIHAVDKEGNTALLLAAKEMDSDLIKILIEAGCDPKQKNNKGESFFDKVRTYYTYSLLKELGYADCVLLERLEKVFDWFICNFLRYYSDQENVEILDELLGLGVSIDHPVGEYEESALLYTISHYSFSSLPNVLLEKGIDVNTRNKEGKTVLIIAIEKELPSSVIRPMLAYGADPYLMDNEGRDAFYYAGNNQKLLELLNNYKNRD